MFNIISFFKNYDIQYETQGKNCSPGWINIDCPFCIDDNSNHLGFNLKKNYFNCWKCGNHSIQKIISELLNISLFEAKKIEERETETNSSISLLKIGLKSNLEIESYLDIDSKKRTKKSLDFPSISTCLKIQHKNYLIKRNFDPEKTEKEYSLKGTNHLGNYKFRIIIPIFYNKIMISYIGRDHTEKNIIRYKVCKKEDEIINHKNILFNLDKSREKKIIVVEGVFDSMRLGENSIATFGVEFSKKQLLLIAKKYEEIFIIYDPDEAGRIASDKLAFHLNLLGKKVVNIDLEDKDPGDLDEKEVILLKKDLLGKEK